MYLMFNLDMEAVPKPELLAPVAPARMVNCSPMPSADALANIGGKPFFEALVPFHIHQACSKLLAKRDSLVQKLIAQVDEANSISASTLASLKLPASILALEQPIGLPSIVLTRSQEARKSGGTQFIRSEFEKLLKLAHDARSMLDEVFLADIGPRGDPSGSY